jgi:hypothetical protein
LSVPLAIRLMLRAQCTNNQDNIWDIPIVKYDLCRLSHGTSCPSRTHYTRIVSCRLPQLRGWIGLKKRFTQWHVSNVMPDRNKSDNRATKWEDSTIHHRTWLKTADRTGFHRGLLLRGSCFGHRNDRTNLSYKLRCCLRGRVKTVVGCRFSGYIA